LNSVAVADHSASIILDMEDYLLGVCNIPRELARLCVNCVTAGNYELATSIYKFVLDLFAGFRLLNLRNDSLRCRYDSIKYSVQQIEVSALQ